VNRKSAVAIRLFNASCLEPRLEGHRCHSRTEHRHRGARGQVLPLCPILIWPLPRRSRGF